MSQYFIYPFSFLSIIILFLGCSEATAAPNLHSIYTNEKQITFENDGLKVKAYEGKINVPENRSNPNSRLIPINYIRFPSTGTTSSPPIIYLSGGPGGSGIATAQYPNFRFPLFMAMREFGDVIALDQRGTGASRNETRCVSKQTIPLTKSASDTEITSIYREAAKDCIELWKQQGIDYLGYTTLESAHDIEALRTHFKAKKVTLWGISYGSHLAFASLKVMGDKIDKLIIASAEGLDQTVKLPARTDAYFERLQAALNQQPKAAKLYPNIKSMINRVHKKLERNPISIKISQEKGEPKDFLFQRVHMQGIASRMIADPQRGVVRLLQLYNALDHDITQVLPSIVKRTKLDDGRIVFDVMPFAMDIASGVSLEREKIIRKQAASSLLGNMLNFPMPQLNKVVDGLELGDDFRTYPKSNVPTLLLTGTLDGRTYIQSQREATQGLSDLTQVIIKNAGHNLFMVSPEVTHIIQQFMKDQEIEIKEIEIELPRFVK